MNPQRTEFDIVTERQAFLALAPEWDALWQRASGPYPLTFSFCRHSLLEVADPRGDTLCCVVGRDAGRMTLVWPLLRFRQKLWTALRPLGPDASESSDILVEPGSDTNALMDAAWRHVLRESGADLLYLTNVPAFSRLHWLASHARWLVGAHANIAPVARLRQAGAQGWAAYRRSLGDHEPGRYAKLERRLRARGELDFRIVLPEDASFGPLIDQLLTWKRQWAKHRCIESPWIFSTAYRNFMVGLATDPACAEPFRVMALTLDGTPIALNVLGLAPQRIDGITGSFDPAYADDSPGTLMKACYVRWAFEQGRDVEFGVGTEPFKLFWSRNHAYEVTSFQVAVTAWGRLGIAVRDTVRAARRAAAKRDANPGARHDARQPVRRPGPARVR